MIRPKQKIQTYPDGHADFYAPGSTSRKVGAFKVRLDFSQQSVGVNRFYSSAESLNGSRIDQLIAVPWYTKISRQDIVAIEDRQYRVSRIQLKPEAHYMLLELQSVVVEIPKESEGI